MELLQTVVAIIVFIGVALLGALLLAEGVGQLEVRYYDRDRQPNDDQDDDNDGTIGRYRS